MAEPGFREVKVDIDVVELAAFRQAWVRRGGVIFLSRVLANASQKEMTPPLPSPSAGEYYHCTYQSKLLVFRLRVLLRGLREVAVEEWVIYTLESLDGS